MKNFSVIITIVIIFISSICLFAQKSSKYVFLLSFDGLRYDFVNDSLKNFKFLADNGVKAKSLKPVFPTTTLPNHYSALTGMYPVNHGIIANSFKDPFYNDYFSNHNLGSRKFGKWYISETLWETARRQGIKTGACYWTLKEIDEKSKNPDYLIEFDSKVNFFERIDKGFEWLAKEDSQKPLFISFYFEEPDITSHLHGTKSEKLDSSLKLIDSILGYCFYKLKQSNIFDSTDIVLISDHGTMDFDSTNTIYIDSILTGIRYELQNYGSFMMIDAHQNVIREIYDSLKANAINFDVYIKDNLPEHLNFSQHPYIAPIIILAKPGWILTDRNSEEKSKQLKAIHGYDNNEMNMHGVFYAFGPDFKKNYQTETLEIIDIYPLLCKLLNIMPRLNIDGKFERIKHILIEKNATKIEETENKNND